MAGHWLSQSSETGHVPEGCRESSRRTEGWDPTEHHKMMAPSAGPLPAQQPLITEQGGVTETVTSTPCLQEAAGFYLHVFSRRKKKMNLAFYSHAQG